MNNRRNQTCNEMPAPYRILELDEEELNQLVPWITPEDLVALEGLFTNEWHLLGNEVVQERFTVRNGVKIPQAATVWCFRTEAQAEKFFEAIPSPAEGGPASLDLRF